MIVCVLTKCVHVQWEHARYHPQNPERQISMLSCLQALHCQIFQAVTKHQSGLRQDLLARKQLC